MPSVLLYEQKTRGDREKMKETIGKQLAQIRHKLSLRQDLRRGKIKEARYRLDDGDWITINGTHVQIGEGGDVTAGPSGLTQKLNNSGKNYSQAKEERRYKLTSKQSFSSSHSGSMASESVGEDIVEATGKATAETEIKGPKISHVEAAETKLIKAADFVPMLDKAKATQPQDKAWRVDTYRTAEDFEKEGIKVYSTEGGSTYAIKPDGDIISVCKNMETDPDLNARALMAAAVRDGGTHLDSYSFNYGFYVKCGFEVVSRCAFDESYDIPGWVKGRDKPEDIYFMKYVGVGNVRDVDEKAMLSRVPYSKDYAEAENVLKNDLEGGSV